MSGGPRRTDVPTRRCLLTDGPRELGEALTRWPDAAPEWRSASRTPELLSNVRRTALSAASFSREWFDAVLHASQPTRRTERARSGGVRKLG